MRKVSRHEILSGLLAAGAMHPVEERLCQKCGVPTKGEEAYVNGQFWCHSCADDFDR